jgi:diphthine-ammonia ligase
MKLAILFSGGKDSCLAMQREMEDNHIVCLISLISKNKESYMFHTPNIEITKAQAEAIGLPLIEHETEGEKEEELKDLKKAIINAKEKYKIEGIVTGAIRSVYQASRIQKICDEIGLDCVNPLWQKDQIGLLNEIVEKKFEAIISGVFAYPLGIELLGKKIDTKVIATLKEMQEKYGINPAGEGGEIETTVLDAPFFKKKIEVVDYEISYKNNSGVFIIKNIKILEK